MTTYLIDLPRSNWAGFTADLPGCARPDLNWLALALALALAGLVQAVFVISAGLAAPATAYALALLPTCTGLGLALSVAYLEVTPCHAPAWSGV